jgi:hypothetical protein
MPGGFEQDVRGQAEECGIVAISRQVVAGEVLESTIDSAKKTKFLNGEKCCYVDKYFVG